MKLRTILAVIATAFFSLLGSHATAQTQLDAPPCQQAPYGSGTYADQGVVDGVGEWHQWFCSDGFTWTPYVSYKLDSYRIVTPDLRNAKTPSEIYLAFWKANATIPPSDPRVKPLFDAGMANALAKPMPATRYVVAKNGTTLTRPAFAYSGTPAVRSTTAHKTTRATVGAACDTSVRFVEGSTVYAKVAEGFVAICSKAAPPKVVVYEAEAGTTAAGGRVQILAAASGGSVIGNLNAVGSYSQVLVAGGAGGPASLVISYANGYPSERSLSLYLNGVKLQQVKFATTHTWSLLGKMAAIPLTLASGSNTLKLQLDSGDVGTVDVDAFTITTP